MYSFRDTTVQTVPVTDTLPAEAVSINGMYIENIISGYQTLYTSGRETLAVNLDTLTVGSADGEVIKSRRYPARTITVGFQLVASSPSDFRTKFNHLNNLMSFESADFVFADETDKYFTGTPILDVDVESGRNSIVGEWQIFCPDPFKYSLSPTVRTTDDAQGVVITGNTATFTIDYNGTHECHPTLRAEFASALSGGEYNDDGDCGYVAFADDDGNIIQLGNPDAIDIDEYTRAQNLANREFSSLTDWIATGWNETWGSKTVDGSVNVATKTDTYWARGTGAWSKQCAVPTFNTNAGWHGPLIWKQTTGAINFSLAIEHRMCCSGGGELGTFECGIYNTTSTPYMLAGFVIEKTSAGTSGVVRYIVGGKQVGTASIDLSYYNTHFGYCRRDPVYTTYATVVYYKNKKKTKQSKNNKKTKYYNVYYTTVCTGYTYTQSNLNSSITKSEGTFTFKVGNLAAKTFVDSSLAQIPGHNISMHFGKSGSTTPLNTNVVRSCKFTNNGNNNKTFADVPNVFTAGDVVEANCNDASVYLMRGSSLLGQYAPQYGALGNNWDSFLLHKGENHIAVSWSDWVDADYKPKISIIYNEVYI